MRGLLVAILVLVLAGAIGAVAYDAGLAQGAAQVAAPATGAAPAVAPAFAYYGHPYGWGFGFFPFGFLFPILGFFLFIALLSAVFRAGRWGHGHRGWYAEDAGASGRFAEWHRQAHGDSGSADRPAPPRQ